MGSSSFQIIYKVLLPEAKPSLIMGAAIAITTILGYSAMAGFVGGGGLGAIAINYGYYRYQNDVMMLTVLLLVIIVQIFQELGMRIAKISDRRIHFYLFCKIQLKHLFKKGSRLVKFVFSHTIQQNYINILISVIISKFTLFYVQIK